MTKTEELLAIARRCLYISETESLRTAVIRGWEAFEAAVAEADIPLARYAIAIADSKFGYRSDISLHDYHEGYHVPECRWCGVKKQAGLI